MTMLLPAVMPGSSAEPPLARMAAQSSTESLSRHAFNRRATEAVECPKCGKHSIVSRAHNVFDCLNCNFHRELPPLSKQLVRQQASVPSSAYASRTQSRLRHSLLAEDSRGSGRSSLNALLASEAYRSSLDLVDEVEPEETSRPWVFAAIAVIFGIILL